MLLVGGRVLMTTSRTKSELLLAHHGCGLIRGRNKPRVLMGGLGLGFSLKAALETLPPSATVVVAELHPVVIKWCQGELAESNGGAALDRRVQLVKGDVQAEVARAAAQNQPFDAILWDLYVGPTARGGDQHPLYGKKSIQAVHRALCPAGVFGVWGEGKSRAFEQRLMSCGFQAELVENRGGGHRHSVYFGTKRKA